MVPAVIQTKIENNLIDWVEECKRLCNVLNNFTSEETEKDENKLLALGGLLTDLKFTLSDIIRYSNAMNRVDRFKSSIATGTPDTETKKWLADMIERQLASDEF